MLESHQVRQRIIVHFNQGSKKKNEKSKSYVHTIRGEAEDCKLQSGAFFFSSMDRMQFFFLGGEKVRFFRRAAGQIKCFLFSGQKAHISRPLRVQQRRVFSPLMQKNNIITSVIKKEWPKSQFITLGFASEGNLLAIWTIHYFSGHESDYTTL